MPLFTYIARNADGVLIQGQIEAGSIQSARTDLQEMSLEVEELHEATIHEQQTMPSGPPPLPETPIAPNWSTEPDEAEQQPKEVPKQERIYVPLIDTFRIYTGWLLALLSITYVFGAYQHTKDIPLQIPFVRGLIFSPLLMQVALAAFLFLLLSTLQRTLKGGTLGGIVLTLLGIAMFVLYRMNVI